MKSPEHQPATNTNKLLLLAASVITLTGLVILSMASHHRSTELHTPGDPKKTERITNILLQPVTIFITSAGAGLAVFLAALAFGHLGGQTNTYELYAAAAHGFLFTPLMLYILFDLRSDARKD